MDTYSYLFSIHWGGLTLSNEDLGSERLLLVLAHSFYVCMPVPFCLLADSLWWKLLRLFYLPNLVGLFPASVLLPDPHSSISPDLGNEASSTVYSFIISISMLFDSALRDPSWQCFEDHMGASGIKPAILSLWTPALLTNCSIIHLNSLNTPIMVSLKSSADKF